MAKKYRTDTKVLVIDRGYLEEQTLYEEEFIIALRSQLENLERKLKGKLYFQFDIISVMKEINNGKIFDFVDDKEKVKEQKMKNYIRLHQEFQNLVKEKDYVDRFSTDMIKRTIGDLYTYYTFLVYTESERELEILCRRYNVKAILKFSEERKISESDVKTIYINSIKDALTVAKQMPLFLFQDVKEINNNILM